MKTHIDEFQRNIPIKNLDKINSNDEECYYHAGTKIIKNEVCSVGGRVLNFVCLSNNYSESRKKIFKTISLLNWDNGFFRKDIGYKVINE